MHFHRDVLAIADTFSTHVLRPEPDDVFTGSPPIGFTFGLGGLVVFPLRVGRQRPAAGAGDARPARRRGRAARGDGPVHRADGLQGDPRRGRGRQAAPACAAPSPPARRSGVGVARRPRRRRAADHRRHRRDRDAAHLHLGGRRRHPARLHRPRRPRLHRRVLDDDGRPVPDGTPGHLAVRGPTGCRYLGGDRQEVYVRNGWNFTGDTYVRDADGYFHYQARTDDMIISAGYNIAGPRSSRPCSVTRRSSSAPSSAPPTTSAA